MNRKSITEKAKRSAAYKKAKAKADEYLRSPEKLDQLLEDAKKKAESNKSKLGEIWKTLAACFRLVSAYARGEYREIPWQSIVMIVASIIYFLMPLDVLPDFILGLGLLDDVGLIMWTLKTISADIEKFIEWEASQVNIISDGPGSHSGR